MEISLIILVIVIMSIMGYAMKSLSFSGAITAVIIGLTITIGVGVDGLLLLGAFFATSSLWSKYKSKQKSSIDHIIEKGSRRDFVQVLANGAASALISILYSVNPSDSIFIGFCISIAAANADTWGSEIGSLSRTRPIHIITLKRVARGTSGAISLLGTFASFLGALFIALVSGYLFNVMTVSFLLIVSVFGFLGSIIDTIIGATVQAQYSCEECKLKTEKLAHCGKSTQLIRGYSWMNNDLTNFTSIILATLIGFIFSL